MTRNTFTTVLELAGVVWFLHGVYVLFGYGWLALAGGAAVVAIGYLEG